jgi:tRNA pseudouridine38-40 synthase
MPRLRLTIAYDGRPYAGWQSQPSGQTVQDTLEAVFPKIFPDVPRAVRLSASGRTDAGVHALGQVAHFDTPAGSNLPPDAWQRALNIHLPPTIRIMDCAEVPDTFHSRFLAAGKTYRYRLWTGGVLPPLEAGLACHHPRPIQKSALAEACAALAGTHDFSGFAAFRGNEDGSEDNTRTLWSVQPVSAGDLIEITFHGSGFLYKMVRLLTGGLLRVATEKEPLVWLTDLLHRRVSGKCAHVAPAAGLYLASVDYPANV